MPPVVPTTPIEEELSEIIDGFTDRISVGPLSGSILIVTCFLKVEGPGVFP